MKNPIGLWEISNAARVRIFPRREILIAERDFDFVAIFLPRRSEVCFFYVLRDFPRYARIFHARDKFFTANGIFVLRGTAAELWKKIVVFIKIYERFLLKIL